MFALLRAEYLLGSIPSTTNTILDNTHRAPSINEYSVRMGCIEMARAAGELNRIHPEIVQIVSEMRLLGIRVDGSMYEVILNSCKEHGQWQLAAAFYGDMVKYGNHNVGGNSTNSNVNTNRIPTTRHFASLCSAFRTAGKWETLLRALSLLMTSAASPPQIPSPPKGGKNPNSGPIVDDVAVGLLLSNLVLDSAGWVAAVEKVIPWALRRPRTEKMVFSLAQCCNILKDRIDPKWFLSTVGEDSKSMYTLPIFQNVLTSLSRQWMRALTVYHESPTMHTLALNQILTLLAEQDKWDIALRMMFQHSNGNCTLNDKALSRIGMRCAVQGKLWALCTELYLRNHYRPDFVEKEVHPNELWPERYVVLSLCKAERWSDALRCCFENFRFDPAYAPTPRIQEINQVLVCCRVCQQWEACLKTTLQMFDKYKIGDEMTLAIVFRTAVWAGK
eukprot:PhF_6_TR37610/c0_g1_i3/m.55883